MLDAVIDAYMAGVEPGTIVMKWLTSRDSEDLFRWLDSGGRWRRRAEMQDVLCSIESLDRVDAEGRGKDHGICLGGQVYACSSVSTFLCSSARDTVWKCCRSRKTNACASEKRT